MASKKQLQILTKIHKQCQPPQVEGQSQKLMQLNNNKTNIILLYPKDITDRIISNHKLDPNYYQQQLLNQQNNLIEQYKNLKTNIWQKFKKYIQWNINLCDKNLLLLSINFCQYIQQESKQIKIKYNRVNFTNFINLSFKSQYAQGLLKMINLMIKIHTIDKNICDKCCYQLFQHNIQDLKEIAQEVKDLIKFTQQIKKLQNSQKKEILTEIVLKLKQKINKMLLDYIENYYRRLLQKDVKIILLHCQQYLSNTQKDYFKIEYNLLNRNNNMQKSNRIKLLDLKQINDNKQMQNYHKKYQQRKLKNINIHQSYNYEKVCQLDIKSDKLLGIQFQEQQQQQQKKKKKDNSQYSECKSEILQSNQDDINEENGENSQMQCSLLAIKNLNTIQIIKQQANQYIKFNCKKIRYLDNLSPQTYKVNLQRLQYRPFRQKIYLQYLIKNYHIAMIDYLSSYKLEYIEQYIIQNNIQDKQVVTLGKYQFLMFKMKKGEKQWSQFYKGNNKQYQLQFNNRDQVYSFLICIAYGIKQLESLNIFHHDLENKKNFIKFNKIYKIIDFDNAFCINNPIDESIEATMQKKLFKQQISKSTYRANKFLMKKLGQQIFKFWLQKNIQKQIIPFSLYQLKKKFNEIKQNYNKQIQKTKNSKNYVQQCFNLISSYYKTSHKNQYIILLNLLKKDVNFNGSIMNQEEFRGIQIMIKEQVKKESFNYDNLVIKLNKMYNQSVKSNNKSHILYRKVLLSDYICLDDAQPINRQQLVKQYLNISQYMSKEKQQFFVRRQKSSVLNSQIKQSGQSIIKRKMDYIIKTKKDNHEVNIQYFLKQKVRYLLNFLKNMLDIIHKLQQRDVLHTSLSLSSFRRQSELFKLDNLANAIRFDKNMVEKQINMQLQLINQIIYNQEKKHQEKISQLKQFKIYLKKIQMKGYDQQSYDEIKKKIHKNHNQQMFKIVSGLFIDHKLLQEPLDNLKNENYLTRSEISTIIQLFKVQKMSYLQMKNKLDQIKKPNSYVCDKQFQK